MSPPPPPPKKWLNEILIKRIVVDLLTVFWAEAIWRTHIIRFLVGQIISDTSWCVAD